MPVIAAAAATAFAAVTTATAAVATAAGLTFTGLNIATALSVVKVLSVASSIASLARKPKASLGSPSAVAFKADPNAAIPFVAGQAAVGGNAVHADTHADKNRFLTYATVLSHGGPVKSVGPFTAADEAVTFGADNGEGASGRYGNRMWQKVALGVIGAAALAFTSTANKYTPARAGNITTWGAQHKLSGMAHTLWSMWSDTERYPNGVPKPLWIVWGGPVYDPRKDSTMPGGVGPQRWNNRATWSLDGNDNPQLQAITYLIGHYYNGVKMGGCGVPIRGIDVESFIQGANVSDANGWKISLPWNTGMRKWDVLTTMLQAGGARPIARGSKISCVTSAPRVSVATITEADLAGDFSVTGSQTRRERKNTIIPRVRHPGLKWSVQPYGEVTGANYVLEDGARRALEVEYEGVSGWDGGRQARQLAAYDLTGLREGLVATLPLKPWCIRFRAGDCITIDAPESLMNGQKVVVLKRDVDPQSLVVTLTVQSETDGKHAFALGQVDSPPPTPALTGVDPLVVEPPAPTAWEIEPGVRPGGGNYEAPGGGGNGPAPVIRVRPGPGDYDGVDDEPSALEVLIRYRVAGLNPATGLPFTWSAPVVFTPSADGYELTGLAALTTYELEIAYRARRVTSPWTAYGTVTTGALVATDSERLGDRLASEILADLDNVPALIDAAVADLDLAVSEALSDLNAAVDSLFGQVNNPGGALARIGSLETATADLELNKAAASRVTALEASVNTAGTGLLARTASLETATADLALGKADASRVTVLEARAQTRANKIPNPSGRAGLRDWFTDGSPWYSENHPIWAHWISRVFTGAAGLNATIASTPFSLNAGSIYTLSGFTFLTGLTGGQALLHIPQYDNDGVYKGEANYVIPNAGLARILTGTKDGFTFTAAPGATTARVYCYLLGVNGAPGYAHAGFYGLKLEDGPDSSAFTDDATVTLAAARVLSLETATADLATGKADASRVTALEVTVNTPATGLTARTGALETATADLALGKADASRVTVVEAKVSGVAGATFASDFRNDGVGWRAAYSGAPGDGNGPVSATNVAGAAFPTVAGIGKVLQLPAGDISPDAVRVLTSGRNVKIRARVRQIAGPGGGFELYMIPLDTSYTLTSGYGSAYKATPDINVWYEHELIQPTDQLLAGGGVYYRSLVRVTGGAGRLYEIQYLETTDGTADVANASLSARAASLETATADLALGKADASRVTALEARAGGPNMLPQSQFFRSAQGEWTVNNGVPGASMYVHPNPVTGPGNGELPLVTVMPAGNPGQVAQWVSPLIPWKAGQRVCGQTLTVAASCTTYLLVAAYDASGQYLGESANVPATNVGSPGPLETWHPLAVFWTPPANTKSLRVVLRAYSSAIYSEAWWLRPMVSEATPLQTIAPPFSPSGADARLSVQEVASADLYGRTQARWAVGAAVPGADAFITALAELTPGAAPTSSVAIGARQVAIFNPLGADWKKALEVVGGNVVLSGGLQAGAFIRLGSGAGWPVALKAVDFSAADGEVVNFGTDLVSLPALSFAMNNLAVANTGAGEAYDVRATNLTSTGFTLYAKITVPATPSAQSATVDEATTIASYAGRQIYLGAVPQAADGNYRIRANGYQQHQFMGTGPGGGGPITEYPEQPPGYDIDTVQGYYRVYAYKGGTWVYVTTVYAVTAVDTYLYPSSFSPTTSNEPWFLDETVQIGTGATYLAVVREGQSNGRAGAIYDITNVDWQAQGAGSGTRSATPNGEKTRVTVRPQ